MLRRDMENNEYKKCSKCKIEYEANNLYFCNAKHTKDMLDTQCKKCRNNWEEWQFPKESQKGYKICSVCNDELPIDSIHFNKNGHTQDGYDSRCKVCKSTLAFRNKIRNQENKLIPTDIKTAICNKCNIEKPLNTQYFAFRNDSNKFRLTCKECVNKRGQTYRNNNIFTFIDIEFIKYDENRVCNICHKELKLNQDNFYRDITNPKGLSYKCKECADNLRNSIIEGYKEKHKIQQSNYDIKQVCCVCHKEYPLNTKNFYEDITRKSGFSNQCKQCTSKHRAKYHQINFDKIQIRRDKYFKENRDRILEAGRIRNIAPIKYNSILFQSLVPYVESYRKNPDNEELGQVNCKLCNNWFTPTNGEVSRRLDGINNGTGGSNLYCSDSCKNSCSIYGQKTKPKTFNRINREIPGWLKEEVKIIHEYYCLNCNNIFDSNMLDVHHINPYVLSPQLLNDKDNMIPLCKSCHKEIHQKDKCKLHQLRCPNGKIDFSSIDN